MKTLQERQKEWDDEHTGIRADMNMEQYKYGRPERPSEELDKFSEKAQQPTGDFLKRLQDFKNKI